MWAQAPVAAPPGAARPQSADLASQPPYDRLELLATFRAFESRSYLIEKIRTRGVDFTPDEAFLGAVDAHLKSPDVLTAIAESLRSGSPESPERRKAYLILAPVILDRLTPAIREQYDAAVALAPDSPALHMAYGGVLFLVGDFRAAEAQEWLSIQLWPGDADAHLALAFALAGQGRDDEAIAEAREALRISPDNTGALAELGVELTREHQFKEAVPMLREAIARAPGMTILHKPLGLSLFNTGDIEGAIAEDGLYLQRNPGDAEGHYNLGVAFRAEGRADDAQAQFREAARLAPSNPLFSAVADPSSVKEAPASSRGQRPDDASIDGNTYTNKFFGFSLQFPDGWAVMGADAQRNAVKFGASVIAGGDQTMQDVIPAALAHSYPLLFVMEGKSGGQGISTRSIQISAVEEAEGSDLASGEDFLKAEAKMYRQLQWPLQAIGPPVEMPVGGRVVWRLDMTIQINGTFSRAAEIATIEKGYLLLFEVLSPDQEGLDALLQNMNSVRFTQNSN
jgi:tetratricopeptide (TPR) repeat protein